MSHENHQHPLIIRQITITGVTCVTRLHTLITLITVMMLWWCPLIHWWSLVSLWPARLPAGASSHQSALTTTPALYLWSLPPMHCGKTRRLELSSHHNILNKSKKACSFMNTMLNIKSLNIALLHNSIQIFPLCTALSRSYYILIYHRHHRPETTSSQTFPSTIPTLSSLVSPSRHKIILHYYPSLHNLGILITSLHDLLHCYLNHPTHPDLITSCNWMNPGNLLDNI